MQRPIERSAEDAVERNLADAISITGIKTGGEAKQSDVISVRKLLPDVPLMVGSGVTVENVDLFLDYVNGFYVSSSFYKNGKIGEEFDAKRISAFMAKIKEYRKKIVKNK
jgi:predicted TIM-barrel enzyme